MMNVKRVSNCSDTEHIVKYCRHMWDLADKELCAELLLCFQPPPKTTEYIKAVSGKLIRESPWQQKEASWKV